MKISLASIGSMLFVALAVFPVYAAPTKPKLATQLPEECKVYDILKGQLVLSRGDGKNISQITSIAGNTTDIVHLYDQNGMVDIPDNEHFKRQIERAKSNFPPMAILFQPTGEILQIISVRPLKPAKFFTLFPNINHQLLRDTYNGNYKRLGSIDPKSQAEFFYYPLFQSVGFKDSPLPHIQKGSDLTICYR
jgi:hypothetical protein